MLKVLFVVPSFPLPPHSGGAIAALETLRSIADMCKLHLLTPRPETSFESNMSALKELLPQATVHFYEPRDPQTPRFEMYKTAALTTVTGKSYWAMNWHNRELRLAVQQLRAAHEFDVVHSEWLQTAVSIWDLNIRLLIRTLDVHFLVMRQWSAGIPSTDRLRKSFWKLQAERFRLFEARILSAASAVVTMSAEDEAVLRAEGVTNIQTIPPPRPADTLQLPVNKTDKRCVAVFIGRLDMPVNREAFFIFADHIWSKIDPAVRQNARIVFAGGFPDEALRQRAAYERIELQAPLSDEDGKVLFQSADLFFSPVQSGTGIKIKTVEAMAQGKPIVGFRNAYRGVPAEHGRQALIADSVEDFATAMKLLISNEDLRHELGNNARQFVRDHFNPAVLGARLVDLYSTVAGTSLLRNEAKRA